jgi:membrane protein implicated in regulation of membrane protease activity
MDWLIWLLIGVGLLIGEAFTLAFVAVYFGVAALVAALIAAFGAPVWLQVLVFCAVSLLGVTLTRRVATRIFKGPAVKTNVHTLTGRRGIVTVAISSDEGKGQVRIGTDYWSAKPYFDDSPVIAEGTRVEVLKVEGVTAVVMPIDG